MKYQHIFFDLDGTLTDSADGIVNSVRYALEKQGIVPPAREQLLPFVGPPLQMCIRDRHVYSGALHNGRIFVSIHMRIIMSCSMCWKRMVL